MRALGGGLVGGPAKGQEAFSVMRVAGMAASLASSALLLLKHVPYTRLPSLWWERGAFGIEPGLSVNILKLSNS